MQRRPSNSKTALKAAWICTLALGMLPLASAQQETVISSKFVPLPTDLFGERPTGNPAIDLATRVTDFSSQAFGIEIPDTLTITNEGGQVAYDAQKRAVTYTGGKTPVHLLTDSGLDVTAPAITADLGGKRAQLRGPLTVFQNETVTRATDGGTYDWQKEELEVKGVRTKVQGVLIRGSSIRYATDAKDRRYMVIKDAYISTDDTETPDTWIGAGELTVYPGDYGRLTRLSVASGDYDIPVPVLGWISLSHSLNPEEGYMPNLGTKSAWGAYLLNSYGFLIGNRRVENNMPVSDYVLTLRADYRARRGLAGGLDFEGVEMRKLYKDMTGLVTDYIADSDPMINPTNDPREYTRHERYRIALQARWDLGRNMATKADWALTANVNAVSDRYVLRDFFEDICRLDDKPDNTVTLSRSTPRSETLLYTRFAPNDYYLTDQRFEASYYRPRTAIGKSPFTYETRNSLTIMRQYMPLSERLAYREMVDNMRPGETRDYYARMLNTQSYVRFNTTHELSTSFSVWRFLNVTPKAGAGYTGYYDVGGIGSDNRLLGYLGCDFDIRFNRHWDNFSLPSLDLKGLTHVFHPYATISHGTISSSNELVPQVDTWSTTLGNSTTSPMPLDLMGFTGIDGWGNWTVWRLGAKNILTSERDGSRVDLFSWNAFIDYNIDNPNNDSRFSNLYNIIRFHPSERLYMTLEMQTPTIEGGDDFSQYNISLSYQPTRWFEGTIGHRYINNHPVQYDTSQLYLQANVRINERYTFAGRWHWDIEEKSVPIQQYSIFRNTGAWYIGATLFLRDNGGKKETGFGISFTLGETGTALPVNFF